MSKLILFLSLTLALAGCDGSISDFVNGATRPNLNSPSQAVSQEDAPMSLKVSPGALNGTASGAAISAHVTTTNHLYSSGQVSLRATISRNRVSSQ